MSSLEDPHAAASLMSIDFEKAFNRMSHSNCLSALKKFNADDSSIKLVHAFLYGRTMRVKVGSALSLPRTVPGDHLKAVFSATSCSALQRDTWVRQEKLNE